MLPASSAVYWRTSVRMHRGPLPRGEELSACMATCQSSTTSKASSGFDIPTSPAERRGKAPVAAPEEAHRRPAGSRRGSPSHLPESQRSQTRAKASWERSSASCRFFGSRTSPGTGDRARDGRTPRTTPAGRPSSRGHRSTRPRGPRHRSSCWSNQPEPPNVQVPAMAPDSGSSPGRRGSSPIIAEAPIGPRILLSSISRLPLDGMDRQAIGASPTMSSRSNVPSRGPPHHRP